MECYPKNKTNAVDLCSIPRHKNTPRTPSGCVFISAMQRGLRKCRCVLRKILMAVGIGDGGSRIGICQIPGGRLTIDDIVGTGNHVEVTHFVDKRARLRICSCGWRLPENSAEIDVVWFVGIDVGIVILSALAIEVDTRISHFVRDRDKMALDG